MNELLLFCESKKKEEEENLGNNQMASKNCNSFSKIKYASI